MSIHEERGRYYAKKARQYLEEGLSRRKAHLQANKDVSQKYDVSQRQIAKSTKPYRDGKRVIPDEVKSPQNEKPDDEKETEVTLHDKPYIGPIDGTYYIPLSDRANPMEVTEKEYKLIRKWYSNWNGDEDNIDEVIRKLGWPRSVFVEVKKRLGFTHTSPPFTDQEVIDRNEDDLVSELITQKEGRIEREWQKQQWRQNEKKAKKWDKLRYGQLDPVKEALSEIDFTGDGTSNRFKIDVSADAKHDYSALFGIADCHIGYSDIDEDDWSIRQSGERVLRSFRKLLKRTLKFGKPERIILAFLGDFFHADREDLRTSYGTQMETEGLIEDILKEGYRVAHEIIEMCMDVSDVTIRLVEGNHDRVTSKGLMLHLSKHFSNCDTDLNFRERQYLKYENNLITLWHGDTIKDRNMPKIVADEADDMWGKCDNRYICYGHIHPEMINDENRGATLIRLAGPSGRDEYDYSQGYDPTDALTALRLHPKEGKIGMDWAS